LRIEVTKHKIKIFLPPELTQIENRGNKTQGKYLLPPEIQQIENRGHKTNFFLPPELLQIENRGNKTQNKYFYHQNSYKLRTEVTKHKINIFTTRTPTDDQNNSLFLNVQKFIINSKRFI
jgi:hypothetical protein